MPARLVAIRLRGGEVCEWGGECGVCGFDRVNFSFFGWIISDWDMVSALTKNISIIGYFEERRGFKGISRLLYD